DPRKLLKLEQFPGAVWGGSNDDCGNRKTEEGERVLRSVRTSASTRQADRCSCESRLRQDSEESVHLAARQLAKTRRCRQTRSTLWLGKRTKTGTYGVRVSRFLDRGRVPFRSAVRHGRLLSPDPRLFGPPTGGRRRPRGSRC